MRRSPPSEFLKLLAHDLRWQILALLADSDRRVHELVAALGRPMNLVSYHLRMLRSAGLVHEHRSAADGRDLYYTLSLGQVAAEFQWVGRALHPALGCPGTIAPRASPARVLFLCTRNSARSQMAEALLRTRAATRPIDVASAGNLPAHVDPDAVRAMAACDIDISMQRSKHLDVFRHRAFDYVVTVCDQVRERCPVFPGEPYAIHWSIPDPVVANGSSEQRLAVFLKTAQELVTRIDYFLLRLDAEAAPTPN